MALLRVLAVALLGRGQQALESRILVLRHCARATVQDDLIAKYAAAPMPRWDVPANWCTARGVELVERMGRALVDRWGVDPGRVRFVVDIVLRDAVTASSLLEGVGQQSAPVNFDATIFKTTDPTVGAPVCDKPSKAVTVAERKARFEKVPVPWSLGDALKEMQSIIGVGPAGPIADLGGLTLDGEGKPAGAAYVLQLFGQLVHYAYASGIPFANATAEQANRFLAWHDWYRSITDFNSERVVENAHLLAALLKDPAELNGGTDIYVGHDSNIDGLATVLDLVWDAPPYMGGLLQPTPPMSGLWFEYDHNADKMSVSYLYHAFNTSKDVFALDVSAIRTWHGFESFKAFVHSRLGAYAGAKECMSGRIAADILI